MPLPPVPNTVNDGDVAAVTVTAAEPKMPEAVSVAFTLSDPALDGAVYDPLEVMVPRAADQDQVGCVAIAVPN